MNTAFHSADNARNVSLLISANCQAHIAPMRMIRIFPRLVSVLLYLIVLGAVPTSSLLAHQSPNQVTQTWQMLDYLAVDYAGAVREGAILNASEYQEMREFSAYARDRIRAMPLVAGSTDLLKQSDTLVAAVDAKAAAPEVARQAHDLADALLQAYPVVSAPTETPDLAHGRVLYEAQCAACHGASGQGDGPAGVNLSPPPADFTDPQRADQRSAMSLYQVISQGVPDTAMASYEATLSEADRWALAYYVGTLAYSEDASRGRALWQDEPMTRAQFVDLRDLSVTRVAQLAELTDTARARAIMGYLRSHPDVVQKTVTKGVALARKRLMASLAAYRSGANDRAIELALSAYLDGIEPVEPRLDARDRALRAKLETSMGAYRTALTRRAPVDDVVTQADSVGRLLLQASDVLADSATDATTTFLGAFTILLREGLEALLIVVALLAFLHKAERHDSVRHVHAGWTLALLAGALTWLIASYAVSISGASRELTEGLSSLFAAAVLLSVGLWMHQKSIGGAWQAYLREKMTSALNRRSAGWFLFGLTFISVYREVFETILFFAALWNEDQRTWMLAGVLAGAAALGLIAWILLRTSRRLPLGTFFSASSALIAVLAIVLTGKGVAALQEAGWVGLSEVPMPRIEWLGINPSWQPLLAQLLVIMVLALGFAINKQRGHRQQQTTAVRNSHS